MATELIELTRGDYDAFIGRELEAGVAWTWRPSLRSTLLASSTKQSRRWPAWRRF